MPSGILTRRRTVLVPAAATGGVTLFNDTFTDSAGTVLTAHTSDSAGSWSAANAGTFLISNTNRARCSATGSGGNPAWHTASAAPSSADYDVTCDIVKISADANLMILGRFIYSGTPTGYVLSYHCSTDTYLLRWVNGSFTSLASDATHAIAIGSFATVTLRMRGTTISAIVNGTTLMSVTDPHFSATGSAGLASDITSSNVLGLHADNFQVISA